MFPRGGDFSCLQPRQRLLGCKRRAPYLPPLRPIATPSVILRYKVLPIRSLAIRSCQPGWLLDCRDACSAEAAMDYVTDIAVPGLTSKSQGARKSMCPLDETLAPHAHTLGSHMATPNRSPTATLTISSSSLRPRADIGSVYSQSEACDDCEAFILAWS